MILRILLVRCVVVVAVLAAVADRARAIQVKLYASPAPNRYATSSGWVDWVGNMTAALTANSTAQGNPATDPGAFYIVDKLKPGDMTDVIVTTFTSWKGTVNPAAPFDAERGQRMYFPVVVDSETGLNDIKIENLGNLDIYYRDTDESPFEQAVWATPYGPGSLTYYATDRIGIKADGTVVDSGSADQLVNRIIFRGLGMAWEPTSTTGSDQDKLDAMIAELDDSLLYMRATACYYSDPDPETGVQVPIACGEAYIPEPGAGLLMLTGLAVLGLVRRRPRR